MVGALCNVLNILRDHLDDEVLEAHVSLPSKCLFSLLWISKEELDLCWAEILRIDLDANDSILILSNLIDLDN